MSIERLRDLAVILFVVWQLVLGVWGLSQQALISQSRAQQTIQQLQQELVKEKAKGSP